MTDDPRPIYDVYVTLELTIPVHANSEDEAIALVTETNVDPEQDYIERHLSDGNYVLGDNPSALPVTR